jgi:hypothetical protein
MAVSEQTIAKSELGSRRGVSLIRLTVLILIAAVVLAVALRIDHPKQTRDIVARVASPDANAVGVIYELSGDAKSSFVYQIAVVADGKTQKVAELTGAMRSDRAYGVNLVWTGKDKLDIEYMNAQNAKILAGDVPSGKGRVLVTLHSGVRDEDAQPGGMLFNLREAGQ